MENFFSKIRTSNMNIKNKVINTFLIFLLGIVLGILSKWLDEFRDVDSILWYILNGILDLRNIFSEFGIWIFIAIAISVYSKTPLRAGLNTFFFFVGMTVSYHLYTIYFCGFNPKRYMMIWYGITLLTPIFAFVCWYAKSKSKVALVIRCLIFCVMFLSSFNIGIWYFDLKSIIDLILFIGTILVLYKNPKDSLLSLIISLILAFGVSFLYKINYML